MILECSGKNVECNSKFSHDIGYILSKCHPMPNSGFCSGTYLPIKVAVAIVGS
jgi:hypothetical protein